MLRGYNNAASLVKVKDARLLLLSLYYIIILIER